MHSPQDLKTEQTSTARGPEESLLQIDSRENHTNECNFVVSSQVNSKHDKSHTSISKTGPLSDRSTQPGAQTSMLPYSVSKVRSSRVKMEHDVTQMHNRISLLE